MKKGDLVVALSQPENRTLNKQELEFLGIVKKIKVNEVIVEWPKVGLLVFQRFNLESIDS